MKRALFVLSLGPALLYAAIGLSSQREPHKPRQILSYPPPALVTNLAAYDFDDGIGGPDPQGWVSIDLTAHGPTP